MLKTAANKDLGLFKNILVAKFAAKIRRWGLKTEKDQKKHTLNFPGQQAGFLGRFTGYWMSDLRRQS